MADRLYLNAVRVEALKGKSSILDLLLEDVDATGGVTLTEDIFAPTGYTLGQVKGLIRKLLNEKGLLRKSNKHIRDFFLIERNPAKVNESKFTFTKAETNALAASSPYFAAQVRNPNNSLTLSLANQHSGENVNGPFKIPRNNVRKFLKTIRNNARRGPKVRALAAAFGHSNLNKTTNSRLRSFYQIPAALTREAGRESLAAIKAGEPRFRGQTRSMRNKNINLATRLALEEKERPTGYNWSKFSNQSLTKAAQRFRRNRKTRRNRN